MQIKITPLPQLNKKFLSLSLYPYNFTIQASGHLLSLSKQKSSLKTLVMQVMAWNHPFSRKMVILHLESKEDWLGVRSYYVSQIQSPLVIREQLSLNGLFLSVQAYIPLKLYLDFPLGLDGIEMLCSFICLLHRKPKRNVKQNQSQQQKWEWPVKKCKAATLGCCTAN